MVDDQRRTGTDRVWTNLTLASCHLPHLMVPSRPWTLIAFDEPIIHLKVHAATMRTMRNRFLQIFENLGPCRW